jgi:probable phosphoglycerate mutase
MRPSAAALALACGLGAALPASGGDPLSELPSPAAGTLRVDLVRHGQALSNLVPTPNLPEAQLDHLTELGRRQSETAGRALRGRGIGAVISSPASRARETAEALAAGIDGGRVTVEARLQPLAVGVGDDGQKLDFDARIAEWKAGRDPSPRGGESMERVGERVAELVRALFRERRGGGSVVLVAHSEVIGAYVGRVRGAPPWQRYPPGIGNGSISVVDVGEAGGETLALLGYLPQAP